MSKRPVSIITDGSGDFTKRVKCSGEILDVKVIIGDLDDLALTITDDDTGQDILDVASVTATSTFRPVEPIQTTAGVDIAYAAGPPVVDAVLVPKLAYEFVTVTAVAAANKRGEVIITTR